MEESHDANINLEKLLKMAPFLTRQDVLLALDSYIPWFYDHGRILSHNTLHSIKTLKGMWLNLFEVLFWYCCLLRKAFGDTPDEYEFVDASAYISGIITNYDSLDGCLKQIEHAMEYFVPNQVIREALVLVSLKDVGHLIQDQKTCLRALLEIKNDSFQQVPKQAHYLRLLSLIDWYMEHSDQGHCLNDTPTLSNLNKQLTSLHAAICNLHAATTMHVLYSATIATTTPQQPAFITHHNDSDKFAKKLSSCLAECHLMSEETIKEGLRKMVAVWRRKAADMVVVSVLVFGLYFDTGLVCADQSDNMVIMSFYHIDSWQSMHEYLCKKYHLRPVLVDNELIGLLLMPILELPITASTFEERTLQFHRLNPNTEKQLVIASHKLPLVMTYLNDHCKFMDGEGRVYEYIGGYIYRHCEEQRDAHSDSICVEEGIEMVLSAHLYNNSIMMLPSNMQFMYQFVHSYTPVLFNQKYPLLYQLSMVLSSTAVSQKSPSKAESDMLSQLLQAITKYHQANSGDLFQSTTVNSEQLYGQLRVELEIVGRLVSELEGPISSAYALVDEESRLKRAKEDNRPGSYLAVQKADKPEIPKFTNTLLSRYYRYHTHSRRD